MKEDLLEVSDNESVFAPISDFIKRNTAPMKDGSLRLAVINLLLCGTTGTFFWYPVIFRYYGYIPGAIVICIIAYMTYMCSLFIFQASFDCKKDSYLGMIKYYLGKYGYFSASITFLADYFATFVIGILLSYNILLYLLYYAGKIDE